MERYLVTMQFYINAKDDSNAKREAEVRAIEERIFDDNQAQVISIEHAPFGKIGQNRKIKLT